MVLKIKLNNMEQRFKAINDKYFDFEIFEEIFEAINKMKHPEHDMFNAGIASADGAIRRLREEYYESIVKMYEQEGAS
jgi:hypothetical protein